MSIKSHSAYKTIGEVVNIINKADQNVKINAYFKILGKTIHKIKTKNF